MNRRTRRNQFLSAAPSIADDLLHRSEPPGSARTGLMHRSKETCYSIHLVGGHEELVRHVEERAADPLHGARIDPKPSRDLANALCASRPTQCLTDTLLLLCWYRGPAEPLALALGPRKPGADSFLNDRALELGKYAQHLV